MTISSAFNEIAVEHGGTADKSGTITGAIDALNDALAGSDQEKAQTIEGAVRLLGAHIGGGGGGGGDERFVVNLTRDNDTYTADHDAEEIYNAFVQGKTCVAYLHGSDPDTGDSWFVYPLYSVENTNEYGYFACFSNFSYTAGSGILESFWITKPIEGEPEVTYESLEIYNQG